YFTSVSDSVPHVAIALDMNHERLRERYTGHFGVWLRYKYAEYLMRATRVIAISQSTKDDIIRYYGIDPGLIDVVHLATDARLYRPEGDRQRLDALGAKYGLRRPYILYVGGRFTPYKNFQRLVEAFALSGLRNELTLVTAGSPLDPSEQELISNLGLRE